MPPSHMVSTYHKYWIDICSAYGRSSLLSTNVYENFFAVKLEDGLLKILNFKIWFVSLPH